MNCKFFKRRELDNKTLRDSIAIEGDKLRHMQVEHRNGNVFMRMKTRNLQDS